MVIKARGVVPGERPFEWLTKEVYPKRNGVASNPMAFMKLTMFGVPIEWSFGGYTLKNGTLEFDFRMAVTCFACRRTYFGKEALVRCGHHDALTASRLVTTFSENPADGDVQPAGPQSLFDEFLTTAFSQHGDPILRAMLVTQAEGPLRGLLDGSIGLAMERDPETFEPKWRKLTRPYLAANRNAMDLWRMVK